MVRVVTVAAVCPESWSLPPSGRRRSARTTPRAASTPTAMAPSWPTSATSLPGTSRPSPCEPCAGTKRCGAQLGEPAPLLFFKRVSTVPPSARRCLRPVLGGPDATWTSRHAHVESLLCANSGWPPHINIHCITTVAIYELYKNRKCFAPFNCALFLFNYPTVSPTVSKAVIVYYHCFVWSMNKWINLLLLVLVCEVFLPSARFTAMLSRKTRDASGVLLFVTRFGVECQLTESSSGTKHFKQKFMSPAALNFCAHKLFHIHFIGFVSKYSSW